MSFFVLLFACSSDLPAGWEDALPVDSFSQADCDGSPYEAYESTVSADLSGDPLQVLASDVPFRCVQDVEGYYRTEGTTLQVLVQPIDMHPSEVAACDCLYDLTIGVEGVQADAVDLYRRWDAGNEPNDPVFVGSAAR